MALKESKQRGLLVASLRNEASHEVLGMETLYFDMLSINSSGKQTGNSAP